jgi:glucose-6-phosphate 1-epimerase
MSLEQWNSEYGIEGQVEVLEGEGGFPLIKITNDQGTAEVSLYAGHVLSFRPATESEDLIFVSSDVQYKAGKAIRGGIPICWPWFGPDPEGLGRPNHGFVRNRLWNVVSTAALPTGETQVTLGLKDTDESREIWPYAFDLTLELTVGSALTLALVTRNLSDQTFSITQALHTYFKIGDINPVQVLGLEGLAYIDKMDAEVTKTQSGVVTIAEPVDRIYLDAPSELVIDDPALGRRIRITSTGSQTAVVWNPWIEGAAQMGDLGDQDYQHFVCVETVNAAKDVIEVSPKGEHRLVATYTAERDG